VNKVPNHTLEWYGFWQVLVTPGQQSEKCQGPKATLSIVNSLGLINSYRKAPGLSNEIAAKASRVTSVVNINGMVLAPIIRGYRLDVEMHLNIVNFFIVLGP